ncbi:MAG: RNA polymerase sigma factor [Chloroflexota bacterium]
MDRTGWPPPAPAAVERHAGAVQSEDETARFDALYEAHRQALHAFFLGRTSDAELALDLLQEAFVRAWRNLGTLSVLSPQRQRAWLFAVARNLVVDQYRSRAARGAAHDALAASLDPSEQVADGPEVTTERDRDVQLVDEAIGRLPEDLRTVLLLQLVGERTSAEIGELLGRPAGTVRYQLSRARKRLTELLRALDAEDTRVDLPSDTNATYFDRPSSPRSPTRSRVSLEV